MTFISQLVVAHPSLRPVHSVGIHTILVSVEAYYTCLLILMLTETYG